MLLQNFKYSLNLLQNLILEYKDDKIGLIQGSCYHWGLHTWVWVGLIGNILKFNSNTEKV